MIKRVLISGANGFVGAHICHQALQLGWDVVGIKRSSSNTSSFEEIGQYYQGKQSVESEKFTLLKNALRSFADDDITYTTPKDTIQKGHFQWVNLDLNQKEDVLEVLKTPYELIIHTAAKISFDRNAKEETISQNIEMTRNLVNACIYYKQPQLIHISSIAALGRPENDREIDINSAWSESSYNTAYAISKHLSEMETWRGAHEGLKVLVVNPGVILGFSASKSSSAQQVIKSAIQKIPLVPIGSNGFIFVEDLAFRILSLTSAPENWNRRHLMVSHNLSFIHLFLSIQKSWEVKRRNIMLSNPLWSVLWILLRLFELLGISLPVSTELLKSTKKLSRYDNRKGHTASSLLA